MTTETPTKAEVITAIADVWEDLSGRRIDAQEFDFLYDKDIEELMCMHIQLVLSKLERLCR
jgi:hypothetical protein